MSVLTAPKTENVRLRYHWTVEAFYRAVDAGVFDEPTRLTVADAVSTLFAPEVSISVGEIFAPLDEVSGAETDIS